MFDSISIIWKDIILRIFGRFTLGNDGPCWVAGLWTYGGDGVEPQLWHLSCWRHQLLARPKHDLLNLNTNHLLALLCSHPHSAEPVEGGPGVGPHQEGGT